MIFTQKKEKVITAIRSITKSKTYLLNHPPTGIHPHTFKQIFMFDYVCTYQFLLHVILYSIQTNFKLVKVLLIFDTVCNYCMTSYVVFTLFIHADIDCVISQLQGDDINHIISVIRSVAITQINDNYVANQ